MKKDAQNPKIPNHIQIDSVSAATKLLEKRRQMYEVHEAFEAQKEQYKAQQLAFERQEAVIRERDLQIQEDLIRHCKFLNDNEAKKARAEKRKTDEELIKREKETQIQSQTHLLEKHKENSQILDAKVKALRVYEEYLESVLKAYPEIYEGEITAIVNTHKTLQKAQKDLTQSQENITAELQRIKNDMATYEKEKNYENLMLGTDLATCQGKLEDAENKRNELQDQVESRNLERRMLMAIDNIYSRCEYVIQTLKEEEKKENKTFEAKNEKKPTTTKPQQKKDNKESNKDNKTEENTDDYLKKCEKAIEKLAKIKVIISDFQKALAECRLDEKALKPKKAL